jgi:hypothetical protein
MPDDLELREQTLPEQADWETACKRAAALFGLTIPTSRNASNVAKLVEDVQAKARESARGDGQPGQDAGREVSAVPDWRRQSSAADCTVGLALLAGLAERGRRCCRDHSRPVRRSRRPRWRCARRLAKARELDEAARTAAWEIFEAMKALADDRQVAGRPSWPR